MSEKIIKAGVIGDPISHSLSPVIHRHWLEKYNINGTYEAILVKPGELGGKLKELADKGYAGVNVTIPHKEKVMECTTELEETAKKIGAANTLTFNNGGIYGENTDWFGFWFCISNAGYMRGEDERVMVLGAGGAARGVIYALMNEGIKDFLIVNRDQGRAEKMAEDFEAANIGICGWSEIEAHLPDIDLLVNATSLGMRGQPTLEIDLTGLKKPATVGDIIYNPLKTGLLLQAEKLGFAAIGGLDMLIGQAVPGFEKWFGVHPKITPELRQLLVTALEKQC